MLAQVFTVLAWLLVAASATFWGFKLFAGEGTGSPLPSATSSGVPESASGSDLVRLLGGTPLTTSSVPAPSTNSRFRLGAVIASRRAGGSGVALISIDGKPARVFRVGAAVDGAMVLQSVGFRSASIGPPQGAPAVVLELPALSLPSPSSPPVPAPFVAGTGIQAAQDAVVAPATNPSVRKITPGQRSPGRRMRLRSTSAGGELPLVGEPVEN